MLNNSQKVDQLVLIGKRCGVLPGSALSIFNLGEVRTASQAGVGARG